MKLFPLLTFLLPPSKFKNILLNLFPNVNIASSSYIGFSYIDVNEIDMQECSKIKHFVKVKGLNSILLKKNSFIGNYNTLYCNPKLGSSGHFILGENSELVRKNFLDLTGRISIGNNVVIGGFGSQFWTHGFDIERNRVQGDIKIEDNVYIGSSTILNLGVLICSNVSVGSGSVISKSILNFGFYAGVPAIKKHDNIHFSENEVMNLISYSGKSKFFEKKIK